MKVGGSVIVGNDMALVFKPHRLIANFGAALEARIKSLVNWSEIASNDLVV